MKKLTESSKRFLKGVRDENISQFKANPDNIPVKQIDPIKMTDLHNEYASACSECGCNRSLCRCHFENET